MQTDPRVEIVAKKLTQLVPDFTVSEIYQSAKDIVETVESIKFDKGSEPTA